MKRLTEIFLPSILLLLVSVACGSKMEVNENTYHDKLFKGTCKITASYIDSMKNAKDSTSLKGLLERYDLSITTLNFSVPADTDLNLTEGQNDTIATLVDSIRKVYELRMDFLLHHQSRPDSIGSDSIAYKKVLNEALPSGNSGNRISK